MTNTSSFYYMEWLRRTRAAPFLHVPYKTSPQSHTANIAGEVMVNLYGAGLAVAPIKAGKLRALAVTGDRRSVLLPDVPSFKEAGIDLPIRTWYGLFAPAGTPRDIVQRRTRGRARGRRAQTGRWGSQEVRTSPRPHVRSIAV